MNNNEVNKAKAMLVEIMLRGTTGIDVIPAHFIYKEGLVKADMETLWCWVLTDKGHRWLDEHV